jgi:hypothetical protein
MRQVVRVLAITLCIISTTNGDEIVRTSDGRSVVLKADGTWAYVPDPAVAVPNAASMGTLSLETGIVYQMGGPQPVARERFRLLSRSLKDITAEVRSTPEVQAAIALVAAEKAANEKKRRGQADAAPEEVTELSAAMEYTVYPMLMRAATSGSPTAKLAALQSTLVDAAIERATVAALTTGFDGRGSFDPVTPGSYFVLGNTHLRGGKNGLWCVPVQVRPGASSFVLDQNNLSF